MVVKRIVMDIATDRVSDVAQFYADLFDLTPVMDQGWITTLANGRDAAIQISIASQGDSGTVVPDMSIEVDDVDSVCARARDLRHLVEYGPVNEPWGVRRFFVRDPAGKLINVLSHTR